MNGQAEAIRRHVYDILASPGFVRSKKLAAFLRWLVERALVGETESITERSIAIGVYERPPDFDPKLDGTVRAEAIRLRHKLREYYASATGPQRIDVPKGGYVPIFSGFEAPEMAPRVAEVAPVPVRHPARLGPGIAWAGIFILLLASLTIGLKNQAPPPMPQSGQLRAAKLTSEASQFIRGGDNITAVDRLNQAIALAPQVPEAHRLLSSVSMNLGHENEMLFEARLAESLAPAGSEERMEVEANQRSVQGDIPGAVALYTRLAAADPHSFDLLISLARSQLNAHQFDAGLATINPARRLPEAVGSPVPDRLTALAWGSMALCEPRDDGCVGESPGQLQARAYAGVKRARAIATAAQSRAAMGRVILLEGGLEANMGLVQDSISSVQTAQELCTEVHDDLCVAAALRIEGNRRVAKHKYSEALQLYEKALALALRWQNRGESRNVLEGIEAAADGIRQLEVAGITPLLHQPDRPVGKLR